MAQINRNFSKTLTASPSGPTRGSSSSMQKNVKYFIWVKITLYTHTVCHLMVTYLEKVLGVNVDPDLKFSRHIKIQVNI